jgi:glycosyltransferase involved in cell wall biosynthesis
VKLSVVVPGWYDPFMQRTIDTLLDTSELDGEIEVIAVVDGSWLATPLKEDSRVTVIQFDENRGMRAAINAGLAKAQGRFIMKVDAHCCFDQGFAKSMVENCAEDWMLIPRRYSLDDVNWTANKAKPTRDYHYLLYPSSGMVMTPHDYPRLDRNGIEIDDTMSFQGSCWVANRNQFMKRVGFLDDSNKRYGSFAAEQLETGLKYWLGGGEVKVNKKTWYAHLWKMPRHYAAGEFVKKSKFWSGWNWATQHWFNDREPVMVHKLAWLVEKFWPVPTWPEDRSLWIL